MLRDPMFTVLNIQSIFNISGYIFKSNYRNSRLKHVYHIFYNMTPNKIVLTNIHLFFNDPRTFSLLRWIIIKTFRQYVLLSLHCCNGIWPLGSQKCDRVLSIFFPGQEYKELWKGTAGLVMCVSGKYNKVRFILFH
jgi:hypothetical protein